MTGTKRGGKYPAEMRERAVRMVMEHQQGLPPVQLTVLISAQSHLRDGCALIDTSELSGTMC